jgi:hypothetical protein
VDDRLGVHPRRVLDDNLRAGIRANKEALLLLLSQGGGGGVYPPSNHCNGATASSGDAEASPTAVLLRSNTYDEVWLAFGTAMVDALGAEEALRDEPRPILRIEGVTRLRGKADAAIRAVLETARVWPGASIVL